MGPYYIPASPAEGSASGHRCSWYAPGASGGVNIDGGAAADPERGMIFVGSQSGLGTMVVQKDPCSEFRYSSPFNSCGIPGALPPPEGYEAPAAGRGGRGGRNVSMSSIGGVSIVKPRELGGVTAYNMTTGDKAWWIPNGGFIPTTSNDPLFAGVSLPPRSSSGQPQVMNTRTLTIYGTGRNGGPPGEPPRLFAVDKATGRQVGAVQLEAKTSAVPMTFLHRGRQYIVFASGGGNNPTLTALTLPRGGTPAGGRGGRGGGGRGGGRGGGGGAPPPPPPVER
jgi:quinoprotein glucose dehydrogenase